MNTHGESTYTMNMIYHEDNRKTLSRLPDHSVNLVVTSPPYDHCVKYSGGGEDSWDYQTTLKELYRVLVPGGVVCWVVGDQIVNGSETLSSFTQALYGKSVGFSVNTIIYRKMGPSYPQTRNYLRVFDYLFVFSKGRNRVFRPTQRTKKTNGERGNEFNVWYILNGSHSTRDTYCYSHPGIIPEELVERCITTWSNPYDLVYDPFCGTGTTPKMCIKTHRNFLGSELSKDYYDISLRRVKQYQEEWSLAA